MNYQNITSASSQVSGQGGSLKQYNVERMYSCSFLLLFLYTSPLHATPTRQEITAVKQQKEALNLEKKKLLAEADAIGTMIEELSLLSDKEKEMIVDHQEQISKTLPLLARLERSNPLRMVIEPTMGQEKVRGIILMRFLISSIKRKIQQVQENLNNIKVQTTDLTLKSHSTHQLLQDIERQKEQLTVLENTRTKIWIKAESDRLEKEEDPNTLLNESRGTISKTTQIISAATAIKGFPFRRLEQPVKGKIFKDSTLQTKFSPHARGIFFKTQKNAQICAPAKGTVVFKGPFRHHAEILILDHGETAHTILIGMDKIDAEVGKNVYAGQKLGTMAGYGSGQPHLYLELRHKGQSVDPTPYFVMKKLE